MPKDKKSKINFILKSGGFGEENFFEKVFKKAKGIKVSVELDRSTSTCNKSVLM